MHTLRTAVIAALLAALALPIALAQEQATPDRQDARAAARPRAWQILAVDQDGTPVPGVSLELIDTVPGAVAARSLGGARRTDGGGRIAGDDAAPYVLDIASRDERWSVAYVHAARFPDETMPVDLLGHRLHPIDFSAPVVCVLHRTGTIRVRVEGATATDRFHVSFTDERPEPASHRRGQAASSFDGPTGELRAPAGRGTLYVASDGALGAPVLANGRPLLVAVAAGRTTEIALRFEQGPTTTLLAPFDTIPFDRLEALTPDGSIVVADLPFAASPLRVPSALPIASGTPFDPKTPMGVRLPKHLLRAADVPIEQPFPTQPDPETDAPRRAVDTAPVVLTFPVDLGGKVRFPEVESGWLQLAGEGIMVLAGSTGTASQAVELRSAPGLAQLGQFFVETGPLSPDLSPWSCEVALTRADGRPAAYRELLVATRGLPPMRAITDAAGELRIRHAVADDVVVASLASLAERITLTRADGETVAGTLTLLDRTQDVGGTWKTAPDSPGPVIGGVLALIPVDAEEAAARRAFGTRAYPLAITDSTGAFTLRSVPLGDYLLRTDRGTEHAVTIGPGEGGAIDLVGEGGDGGVTVNVKD